jgi:hypothetical protein
MLSHIKAGAARTVAVGAALPVLMIGAFVLAGSANAVGEDPIDAAFTDLQGKVTLYGGAVVALVVASIILLFGIKWLRKGSAKA